MEKAIKQLALSKLYSYMAIFVYIIGLSLVTLDYVLIGGATILVGIVLILTSVFCEAVFMFKVLLKK